MKYLTHDSALPSSISFSIFLLQYYQKIITAQKISLYGTEGWCTHPRGRRMLTMPGEASLINGKSQASSHVRGHFLELDEWVSNV